METDTIYNIDCLEGMKHIPDGSIDAIICDLPYGTTANSWDSVIPFDQLWEQYKRIVKPNAPIVLFGSEPFSTYLRMSNMSWFKYDWIWEKEQGGNFMLCKYQPYKVHEIISVFSKGSHTYNPQMEKGDPYISGKGTSGDNFGNVQKVQTKNEGTRFPRSVRKVATEKSDPLPSTPPKSRWTCCGTSSARTPTRATRFWTTAWAAAQRRSHASRKSGTSSASSSTKSITTVLVSVLIQKNGN